MINGKQVWPVPANKGRFNWRFKKGKDGYVVYTETPLNEKGNPSSGGPAVLIEMDRREVQSFAITVARGEVPTPKEKHAAEEVIEGLRRLDKGRKETEHRK
jgi:hypothetical protein